MAVQTQEQVGRGRHGRSMLSRRRALRGDGQGGRWLPGVERRADAERLARGLGWLSIGIGLAEVLAPRSLGRLVGVGDHAALLRALGLREIAAGAGALAGYDPAPAIWSRVAGDALDLSLLGLALASSENRRGRVAFATAAVAGVTALDALCAQTLSRGAKRGLLGGPVHVVKAITINRPPEEVYRFWRDFANLPRFMSHLEEVHVVDERRSHWRAKAPAGMTVEWGAEVTEERPSEIISWRSLEGADVPNEGTVRFKPGPRGRGTEVHVEMRYKPPAGRLGATLAMLFGEEPSQQAQEDLRNLKRVLETGEIIRSDASLGRIARAARPPEQTPAC